MMPRVARFGLVPALIAIGLGIGCLSASASPPALPPVTINVGPGQTYTNLAGGWEMALTHLRKGEPVTLQIAKGVYPELWYLNLATDTAPAQTTPLTIAGDPTGGTIISGLLPTGFEPATWRAVPGHSEIYEHVWLDQYGVTAGPGANIAKAGIIQGVGMRSEMLVIDGRRLTPCALDVYEWVDPDGPRKGPPNQPRHIEYRGLAPKGFGVLAQPWSFAVVDNPTAPVEFRGKIFMRLPPGTDIQTLQRIQVSRSLARDRVFRPLVEIRGKTNLIIRNLNVREAGTALYSPALRVVDCGNVIVENCACSGNNGVGLQLQQVRGATVRQCRTNDNGCKGFGIRGCQDVTLTDCEFNSNNWRGALCGFHSFGSAGIKMGASENVTVQHCAAVGNLDMGFWVDVACRHSGFEHCFAWGNTGNGFMLEFDNQQGGSNRVEHCVAAYNESGVYLSSARRPTVTDNLLFANRTGIVIVNWNRRPPVTAAEYIEFILRGNTIIAPNGELLVRVFDRTTMLPVVNAAGNHYETTQPAKAFRIANRIIEFTGWRASLLRASSRGSRDADSTLTAPNIANAGELLNAAETLGVPVPRSELRNANGPAAL